MSKDMQARCAWRELPPSLDQGAQPVREPRFARDRIDLQPLPTQVVDREGMRDERRGEEELTSRIAQRRRVEEEARRIEQQRAAAEEREIGSAERQCRSIAGSAGAGCVRTQRMPRIDRATAEARSVTE